MREFAKTQMKRFSHLDGFPLTKEGAEDFMAALMRCEDETQLKRVCDTLSEESLSAPKIAQIIAAIKNERAVAAKTAEDAYWRKGEPPKCQRCQDTGMITVVRDGASFAGPCPHCRRAA